LAIGLVLQALLGLSVVLLIAILEIPIVPYILVELRVEKEVI
jgi:hypothetical protein